MITYDRHIGYISDIYTVRNDATDIGSILPDFDKNGWYYLPKGETKGGKVYGTIAEVKLSIEIAHEH